VDKTYGATTFDITTFDITTELKCYTQHKDIMLSVVILNVVMLSVFASNKLPEHTMICQGGVGKTSYDNLKFYLSIIRNKLSRLGSPTLK